MTPPSCECHGESMLFARRLAKGRWVCRIKQREYNRAWYARHRETRIAAIEAYQSTDAGRRMLRRKQLARVSRERADRIQRRESEWQS